MLVLALLVVIPWAAASKNVYIRENVERLMEWIPSLHEGVVSDKVSLREDHNVTTAHSASGTTLFLAASQDISKDETVMIIPKVALFAQDTHGKSCRMLKNLLNEYDKGEESLYYPYIQFLFGDEKEDDSDTDEE